MNSFRVVLYGLAVVAAVCAGDARAFDREGGSGGKGSMYNPYGTQTRFGKDLPKSNNSAEFLKKLSDGSYVWEKKFTLVAAAASSQLDQEKDALAALVDTAGVSVDFYNLRSEIIKSAPQDQKDAMLVGVLIGGVGNFGVNFCTNYGMRKFSKYLNCNGCSVKSCLGDSAAVKVSTDIVMHPQMLTFLFWATIGWLHSSLK